MISDDDEALRWEGDAEPSYRPRSEPAPVVEPRAVEPTPVDEPVAVEPTPVVEPVETAERTTSFLLVSYGILAGAYLIYSIGWAVPILTNARVPNPDVLGEFMVRVSQLLAIASPAIWFGATLLLTRGRRPIVRLLALIGGLVVLLPWPYLLLGV